jgi:hypothetical protein
MESWIHDKNVIAWIFIHPERQKDILITEDISDYKTIEVEFPWNSIKNLGNPKKRGTELK